MPGGAERREHKWLISPTRFLRKEGRRIFWITRITVNVRGLKDEIAISSTHEPMTLAGYADPTRLSTYAQIFRESPTPSADVAARALTPLALGQALGPDAVQSWLIPSYARNPREVCKGRSVFDVIWSVAVSTARKMTRPKLEDLQFIETVWDSNS
jgi:hypothetical protein